MVSLDMTTAEMAFYGLIQARDRGENIPEGIAYDEDGAVTTDPACALRGAIRHFRRGKGLRPRADGRDTDRSTNRLGTFCRKTQTGAAI